MKKWGCIKNSNYYGTNDDTSPFFFFYSSLFTFNLILWAS